eukprot:tig00020607_g11915.t1
MFLAPLAPAAPWAAADRSGGAHCSSASSCSRARAKRTYARVLPRRQFQLGSSLGLGAQRVHASEDSRRRHPRRFVVSSEHAVADAAPERPAGPRPASSAPAGAPQAAPEPPEELARRLGSDASALNALSAAGPSGGRRGGRGGANAVAEAAGRSFGSLLWEALQDGTLRILVAAAGVSIAVSLATQGPAPPPAPGAPPGVEEVQAEAARGPREAPGAAMVVVPHEGVPPWVDGVSILGAVALVSAVTAANNYTKEAQFRALNRVKNDRRARVVRGGAPREVQASELVVGDLVLLEAGDQVPADGVLVAGFGLEADESGLTGESDAVKKGPASPLLLAGTQVCTGVGRMLVTAVGEATRMGSAMGRLRERDDERKTPLQKKLEVTAEAIGRVGLAAAVLTVAALCVRWGLDVGAGREALDATDASTLLSFFITGVTILVMAVPEGLPLAVTVSLAYSVRAMLADQNLVRHLDAAETMGGATNILSDKTGTLTENRMSVVEWRAAGAAGPSPPLASLPGRTAALLREGVALNSTASVAALPSGALERVGSRTECVLLAWLEREAGLGPAELAAARRGAALRAVFPFSSAVKSMTTIVRTEDGGFRLHVKGAPERLLARCERAAGPDGREGPLGPAEREALLAEVERMAASGLRTLCLAYAEAEEDGGAAWEGPGAPGGPLTFLAFVGIKDPVRKEVPAAVEACKRAGITVRMCTGDNALTAVHIARECGIMTEGGLALTGEELQAALARPDFDTAVLPRLQVLARASPTDKLALVRRLRGRGEVVAVTGDGTNDAPALREADVGLSMGLSGTEVAKEASDIVLMDDNFTSIVNAVLWGRCVYDNIRKFVQFQLTVNVVALSVALVAAVTDMGTPLKPTQLLWVNMIMDSLGALALGTERPTAALLARAPQAPGERLISPAMARAIVGHAAFQLAFLFPLLYLGGALLPAVAGPEAGSPEVVNTVLFNAFVFCQLANEVNCRKLEDGDGSVLEGLGRNPLFVAILLASAAVQAAIVQLGGPWFDTVPLPPTLWALSLAPAAASLPYGYLLRKIPLPQPAPRARAGAPPPDGAGPSE